MDDQDWDRYKKVGQEALSGWVESGPPGFPSSVNLISNGVPIVSFQSPFNMAVPALVQMLWARYLSMVNADTSVIFLDSYLLTGPNTNLDDYHRGDLGRRFENGDRAVTETLMVRGSNRDSPGVMAFSAPYRRVTPDGIEERFSDGLSSVSVEFLEDFEVDPARMVEDRYARMMEILVSGASGQEPVPDFGVEAVLRSAEFLAIKMTPDTEWLIRRLGVDEFAPQVYGWSEFGNHPSLGMVFGR